MVSNFYHFTPHAHTYRQPDSSDRPTFPQLVELLTRADFELFAWEEEDLRNSDPLQVKTIGAPLETAKNLYSDLQRSYITQDYYY